MSLLSWERGLKCYPNATTYTAGMSLLSWERGLKYRLEILNGKAGVAPLVGAWIEIQLI